MIEKEAVQKLAGLARLTVTDAEAAELGREIEQILAYVSKVDEVSAEERIPEVGSVYNVMREDAHPHESGVFTEKLLNEAPNRSGNLFQVKRVIE
jgi:aspartyl-tRNA(Asn)/glutamyl-tRNA(Gln) amidotransferase subunit C